jgi:two-component system, NtrC family, response regulator AtoC
MRALIVDDEPAVRSFVGTILKADGWEIGEADSAEHAFERVREGDWSLICCDVVMNGVDGYSALRRFKEVAPNARVILMTGHGTAAGALNAAADGAFEYLLKPFTPDTLQALSREVKQSFEPEPLRWISTRPYIASLAADTDLVGSSEKFIEVMKQVGKVAPTNLPALITGESGTGKEIVARALHRRSSRSSKPFIAVNCGAIPAELIESELFGHVRGAFTGAERDRAGLWEEADGGTVLLDEITETSPAFQVKLLRALQEGEIRRVGSNRTQRVDVRVIAASNRDVESEVMAGRFRQDLFYRLNAFTIRLPPLRERDDDVVELAHHFAKPLWTKLTPLSFAPDTLELLTSYTWPGNIRELENAVMRAVALCCGTVRREDLPERVRNFVPPDMRMEPLPADVCAAQDTAPLSSLDQIEKHHVARVLRHTSNNKQQASRILEVDRKTLDRMIRRHAIQL